MRVIARMLTRTRPEHCRLSLLCEVLSGAKGYQLVRTNSIPRFNHTFYSSSLSLTLKNSRNNGSTKKAATKVNQKRLKDIDLLLALSICLFVLTAGANTNKLNTLQPINITPLCTSIELNYHLLLQPNLISERKTPLLFEPFWKAYF